MNSHTLLNLLSDYKKELVEQFIKYIEKWITDPKSKFTFDKYSEWDYAEMFRKIANEWLVFDWIHVTLQSTGISYDYVAYKNKMLIAYPDTKMDVNLVYEWDEFSFEKNSGVITYTHKFANPFSKKEADIIGAYAIVKNKRGEFITLLSREDLEKHKRSAKTDFIWKAWFSEMCMKTVMKKACKTHFWDIYTSIEEMDNQNYDPTRVNDWQDDLDEIETIEALSIYYMKNKWQGKDFDKAVSEKKKLLLSNQSKNDNT